MKQLLCIVVTCFVFVNGLETRAVPDKFLGEWNLERTENLEEYMIRRGINLFQRKMVSIASVTRIYQQNKKEAGTYDTLILSTFKNAKWYGWRLGQPFNATYVDDKVYEILFDYDSVKDIFSETHTSLVDKSIPADICEHSINEKGELIQRVSCEGVVARRFFSRQTKNQ
ncbi:FABP domain-containing protein [Aphelenchoides bicaudatus]|nr:FABP domain-containing protein [Aphelenchoides bicaudatus]